MSLPEALTLAIWLGAVFAVVAALRSFPRLLRWFFTGMGCK